MTLAPSPRVFLLKDLVHRRASPEVREWFERGAGAAGGSFDRSGFNECFSEAARRLGKVCLNLTRQEVAQLEALGVNWPLSGWGLDELGRVTLLMLAGTHLPESALETLLEECYHQGDNRERQAVLRALPFLPAAERFLPIGAEACRSHIQPLFEALACENPYPALHFPDLNFNQMVLKALFTGVALERVVGLGGRVTPELTRMANDYASERRAAGRSVPPDIWRLTAAKGGEP
ncbi:MAG: EboA domain-containing protein [Candidatus Methylomirabilia bacterium]